MTSRENILVALDEALREASPGQISVRALARRAGVSHNLPGVLFGDRRGLFTAYAARGFRLLGRRMAEAAPEGDAAARLAAMGHAYVDFALEHPARFQLMFDPSGLDAQDPDHLAACAEGFAPLAELMRGVKDPSARDLGTAAWGMVHGLAMLQLSGHLPARSREGDLSAHIARVTRLFAGRVLPLALAWVLGAPQALAAPALPLGGACRALGDMPGPEDFEPLSLAGEQALLVGADDRRAPEAGPGSGLYALSWPSGEARRLELRGRDTCSLRPHGVSASPDGRAVAVVVHHDAADLAREGCALAAPGLLHAVELYAVEDDGALRFVERAAPPGFTSPNDVELTDQGRLFVSDNPPWLRAGELAGDLLLGRRPSRVWTRSPDGEWTIVMDRLVYANGVLLHDSGLMVGTFDGSLARGGGAPVPLEGALDNVMQDAEGWVWTAGHHRPLAFVRHVRDGARPSPTLTHALSADGAVLGTWETPPEARAASTALRLRDEDGAAWLVYAQVFEPGLVACPLDEAALRP